MLVAFVESIKYVGHLLPIAFMRIFLGYFYFNQALSRIRGDFLTHAYLAEDIRGYLPRSSAPDWFKLALENIVIPNWQYFAIAFAGLQLFIGLSYIIGYLVRPFSIIAILLGFATFFSVGTFATVGAPGLGGALGPQAESLAMFLLVLHFTLGWMGAGRCLGVDYYFYKRRRGVWW
jgi:thiosulfate dehydrogenase [quinone] large subunit